MQSLVTWLEAHDKLAGWAQFLGAMVALLLTYFTAFAPAWNRKRQLRRAAARLLSNGYEAIESYHRTSANFLPFPLSVRAAALSMTSIADEIDRFPIYELDDQGSRSAARYLVAVSSTLKMVDLFLQQMATDLDSRDGTAKDQQIIRDFVGQRKDFFKAMLSGAALSGPNGRWRLNPAAFRSTAARASTLLDIPSHARCVMPF